MMFCCVRTRGRKDRKFDDPPAAAKAQPPVTYNGYGEKVDKSKGKDGNMVVLAGAGVAVGATVATAAVVTAADGSGDTGSGGCCCGGGGGGGCGGGGCGGCGGCGG